MEPQIGHEEGQAISYKTTEALFILIWKQKGVPAYQNTKYFIERFTVYLMQNTLQQNLINDMFKVYTLNVNAKLPF